MTTKTIRRITASLPEEDFLRLRLLAVQLDLSMTDVIRRGIRDEEFFQKVKAEGGKVLVKERSGDTYIITEDK